MFRADSESEFTQGYAYTITLKPIARNVPCEDQYDRYSGYLQKCIEDLFPKSLNTLVAEMTKSYDLHFHGIIKFYKIPSRVKNIPKWFADQFRQNKFIGYVLLKVIDDDKGWIDYLKKQNDEFQASTGRSPIIKDDFNISPTK